MSTYVVFDAWDSSRFDDGLTETEARELLSKRNKENDKFDQYDRFVMVTDSQWFAKLNFMEHKEEI